MNEVCERALECYIKKLEKDNETLTVRILTNLIKNVLLISGVL
jgi:hypothetical protein